MNVRPCAGRPPTWPPHHATFLIAVHLTGNHAGGLAPCSAFLGWLIGWLVGSFVRRSPSSCTHAHARRTCSEEELRESADVITNIQHNFPSERAAAAFSAIGLITQIALLAVVTLQKTSSGAGAAQPSATTYVTSE